MKTPICLSEINWPLVIAREPDFLFKHTATYWWEWCTIFNQFFLPFFFCSVNNICLHWISMEFCPKDRNHQSWGWFFNMPRRGRLSFGNSECRWRIPWLISSHLRWIRWIRIITEPMPSAKIRNMATICHFRSKVYLLGLLYTVPIAKSVKNVWA